MKRIISLLIIAILILPVLADKNKLNKEILDKLVSRELLSDTVDTVISQDGYKVRLMQNGQDSLHIGLDLFNDDVKRSVDADMLDFVETALLAKVLQTDEGSVAKFHFIEGNIADLKKLNAETSCKISQLNSRFLSFEWDLDSGKSLKMEMPITYENIKNGTRGEIENDFISKVRKSKYKRTTDLKPDPSRLEPYRKDLYIYPGKYYLKEEINRNTYFTADSKLQPLWSEKYPIESISNLFILPDKEKGVTPVELTVLKHEFGEKATVNTSVENLLGVCEKEGCVPYWGVEDFKDGMLTGSLFLYNWKHGYNHVIKIECVPGDILNGNGEIKARASLYIPANNIQSLFDPM